MCKPIHTAGTWGNRPGCGQSRLVVWPLEEDRNQTTGHIRGKLPDQRKNPKGRVQELSKQDQKTKKQIQTEIQGQGLGTDPNQGQETGNQEKQITEVCQGRPLAGTPGCPGACSLSWS